VRSAPTSLEVKFTIRFTIIVLIILSLTALFLRSWFLVPQVFTPDFIRFQENDPWYHVRAVEYLMAHFPHRLTWDPYALHPGGEYIAMGPLIDYWIAAISLLLGAGNPSLRITHTVCAWFPAVLGSMTTIPVYFLGKLLRDSRTGLIAAAAIAILPGPFFKRSCLGYTDHHVAEAFFSALTVVFLLFVIRFSTLRCARNGAPARPWLPNQGMESKRTLRVYRTGIFAALAGLTLGVYLASWIGGSLFVLTVFMAVMIQLLVDHWRGNDVSKTLAWLGVAWFIALLPVLPFRDTPGFRYHIVALIGSGAFMLAASAIARFIHVRQLRREFLPVSLFVLAACGIAILWHARPNLTSEIARSVARFISGRAGTFIQEARPLLYVEDVFTLRPAFQMFQFAALFTGLGAGILFLRIRRGAAPGGVLVLVWTLAVVLATLVQERFAYYLATNIALLSAYFWSASLKWTGSLNLKSSRRRALSIACCTLMAAIGILPSAAEAYRLGHQDTGPSADWFKAMTWLREHSPEPFGNVDSFSERFHRTDDPTSHSKWRAKYSVMCGWDYGYWVTEIAHRVPTGNPTQSGVQSSAEFFTAQDEESAARIMAKYDARYVIVNDELPVWYSEQSRNILGTFGTIATFAGCGDFDLYEPHLVPQVDGSFSRTVVYYPEYYRSMLNRLYLFSGNGYEPKSTTWAIRVGSFSERGIQGKVIEESRQFATYNEAVAFLNEHAAEPWRIVGLSPFESCVPLEPLHQFRRVYQSPSRASIPSPMPMNEVEIFEFSSDK